jgi:alpha-1,6-mannosyltransferase
MTVKSLHITSAWHERSGGVRTFYLALLAAANASGHPMRLIVPADRNYQETVGEFGKIYHLRAPRSPAPGAYRVLYPHLYLPGGSIHRILRDERPDLVEICDKYTLPYLGGLLRVNALPGITFRPTVVGLSCERFDDTVAAYVGATRLLRPLAALYLRWLYFPLADQHIAVSDYVASELRGVSDGHKVERGVWPGPMGVDFATFSAARPSLAQRHQLTHWVNGSLASRLLIYAGRLAPEKNISVLIHALRELVCRGGSDYRLLLAGDGPSRATLEKEAAATIPGRVAFLGHIASPAQLAHLLANCDLFVHTNPREPFGIAPLEAMAAGVPVVVPASGGVLSYADATNAYLSPPTPEGFAATIAEAFADDAERARRAARARETARERDWPTAAAWFLRLYKALVARTTGSPLSDAPAPLFVSSFHRGFYS